MYMATQHLYEHQQPMSDMSWEASLFPNTGHGQGKTDSQLAWERNMVSELGWENNSHTYASHNPYNTAYMDCRPEDFERKQKMLYDIEHAGPFDPFDMDTHEADVGREVVISKRVPSGGM